MRRGDPSTLTGLRTLTLTRASHPGVIPFLSPGYPHPATGTRCTEVQVHRGTVEDRGIPRVVQGVYIPGGYTHHTQEDYTHHGASLPYPEGYIAQHAHKVVYMPG